MALSFLTPSRTIVLITDEALCIYSTGLKGVRLVETVPWEAENFERNVANILSKDCHGKAVLILNDMVEISFRKERIPKVSPIDKANVIQRKLNLAFPSYPVKAALPLKEKIAKTDKVVASSVYIFAAVPASPALTKTISAITRSLCPIAGFALLPAESSDMVKALSLKQQTKTKNAWAVFIGQHANGGLRQIVTKNGELALTRMTPAADMGADPKGWLRDVSQEFKATMSYLTRFGYAAEDGLSVFVVANKDAGDAMEELIGVPCTYTTLTVAEAAKTLGLALGRSADSNHADTLHIAWAGKKNKLLLPMRAVAIEGVSRPRRFAMLASVALLLGAAFLAFQTLSQMLAVSELKDNIETSTNRKGQLNVQYEKEVQRKEELGFDVKLIQSSLRVHEDFEAHNIRILKMFAGIGNALGRDLKVDKIEIKRIEGDKSGLEEFIDLGEEEGVEDMAMEDPAMEDPALDEAGMPIAPKTPIFEAVLQMTFPSTTDVLKGNEEVRAFRDRIQELLPDNTIEVSKYLKDYNYTNQLVVETGDVNKEGASQDFVAEITLKGVAP